MQESKTLFDQAFQAMQTQRRVKSSPPPHPLEDEVSLRLAERLADVKRSFARRIEWPGRGLDRYDLITSTLTLQKSNHIADALSAIYAALTEGGLFSGVVIGGQSLQELRISLMEAEVALTGGASPRIAPMIDAESLSRTLTRTGFALPVVDVERVTLAFPDVPTLMRDLRAYGCTNALTDRSRRFAPRLLFTKTQDIYAVRFPSPSGGIAATIDLIFLHGWRDA